MQRLVLPGTHFSSPRCPADIAGIDVGSDIWRLRRTSSAVCLLTYIADDLSPVGLLQLSSPYRNPENVKSERSPNVSDNSSKSGPVPHDPRRNHLLTAQPAEGTIAEGSIPAHRSHATPVAALHRALLTQMAQTAVCNRHYSVDQQLCRWLLRSGQKGTRAPAPGSGRLLTRGIGVLQSPGLIPAAPGKP